MNKRIYLYVSLLSASLFLTCTKSVSTHDVVRLKAASVELLADGTTKDTLYGFLPYEATSDKRYVSFITTAGSFDNGKDTMTIPANRKDILAGKWAAVALYTSPPRPGPDTILAKTSAYSIYVDTVILNLNRSVADSIKLSASSFSVKANYGSEVALTGTLFNAWGNKVSLGNRVTFCDFYQDGSPVKGSFRQVNDSSDANSQVSAIYSPGIVNSNIYIYVQATVYDQNGAAHSDRVAIYVSQ